MSTAQSTKNLNVVTLLTADQAEPFQDVGLVMGLAVAEERLL